MRLQKACTATAAVRWPVRKKTKVANQPNTVVKANWNATCAGLAADSAPEPEGTYSEDSPSGMQAWEDKSL